MNKILRKSAIKTCDNNLVVEQIYAKFALIAAHQLSHGGGVDDVVHVEVLERGTDVTGVAQHALGEPGVKIVLSVKILTF